MNELENIVILALLNGLAFSQRGKNYNFLFVPIAAADVIYGFIRAGAGAIPSTTYFIGLTIVILGGYCFMGNF